METISVSSSFSLPNYDMTGAVLGTSSYLKMTQCPHLKDHVENTIYTGLCNTCGWYRIGWFSPLKLKGMCGRSRSHGKKGLYCWRPRKTHGMCAYHYGLYRKRNPFL